MEKNQIYTVEITVDKHITQLINTIINKLNEAQKQIDSLPEVFDRSFKIVNTST